MHISPPPNKKGCVMRKVDDIKFKKFNGIDEIKKTYGNLPEDFDLMDILCQIDKTEDPKIQCLYHVPDPTDPNNINKGYFGVTEDLHQRFINHRSHAKKNPDSGMAKFFDEDHDTPVRVLLTGREDLINRVEYLMRPHRNIAWNIQEGGRKHSGSRGIPVHTPDDTFENGEAAAKFYDIDRSTVSRRCKNANPKWKDWYRVTIVEESTTKLQ